MSERVGVYVMCWGLEAGAGQKPEQIAFPFDNRSREANFYMASVFRTS